MPLAVVGKKWLGPLARSKQRIHDKADPVRVEIEVAMHRRITILPVPIDNASLLTKARSVRRRGLPGRMVAEVAGSASGKVKLAV